MGTQQLILIVLVVVIVAISTAGTIGIVRQMGIQQEKKLLDGLLFDVGSILYEYYLLPVTYGGFGKSVPYMKDNSDNAYALLPTPDAALQSILYMQGNFRNDGFRLKFWPNYWRKFAIGVRSLSYDFERWLLVHCTSGKMEIKNESPRSSDFTTR